MSNRIPYILQGVLIALNFLFMFVPLPGHGLRNCVQPFFTAALLPLKKMKTILPATSSTLAMLLALVLFTTGAAQSIPTTTTPQTTTAATAVPVTGALPDELIALRKEANDAIFNLDYPAAKLKFEEIRKRMPDHPAGDFYLATLIWLEQLYKSRRLQSSLYQNDSFYAGADKSSEDKEGDAVDATVDRAFRDTINRAKTKAIALVNRTNKKDPDALYFLGAIYGVIGAYDASVARKFLGAMRNGSRGVDNHEQVIKLKPDYYDAYLSVGLYNYIVGSLPFAFKAMATFVGIRGNRKKGIAQLEDAMNKGKYINDDARVILIAIYQNEKRQEDALKQLQNLSERFPQNYLIRLETATTLAQLKRAKEAYAMYEDLLKTSGEKAADLIHYQYAEALAMNQDYERAAEHFLAVTKTPKAEAGLVTWSTLRAGQVYDQASKRNEAIAQYKAVLTRPNVYDTREQAEKGLKEPYKEKEKKREGDE